MKTASSIAAMVVAASTLFACGGQGQTGGEARGQPTQQQKQGEVLASVGNGVITVDEFNAKMEEQSPFIRSRYASIERKQEFLDNLVRFEVLAQEAERRGLDKDPDVVAAARKVMVQKLMRAEFDENQAAQEISEQELRSYYDAHVDDYVKPERVRASHVFFEAPEGSANRSKVKREAIQILADVRGKEAGPVKVAFAEAAKAHSTDTATKAAGGNLLFKTREELALAWGAKFADAVFGIKNIGDMGALVETEKGFHLIKLTGRQNALDRDFDSVKGQIQNRLFREKRTQAFEDFVARLKDEAKVQVKEDVLANLDVTGGAIGAPTGPGAGAIGVDPVKAPGVRPQGLPGHAPGEMGLKGLERRLPTQLLEKPAADAK